MAETDSPVVGPTIFLAEEDGSLSMVSIAEVKARLAVGGLTLFFSHGSDLERMADREEVVSSGNDA